MYSFNLNEEDNKKKRSAGEAALNDAFDGTFAGSGAPLLQPTDVDGAAQHRDLSAGSRFQRLDAAGAGDSRPGDHLRMVPASKHKTINIKTAAQAVFFRRRLRYENEKIQ
jgi:hypothetical protein